MSGERLAQHSFMNCVPLTVFAVATAAAFAFTSSAAAQSRTMTPQSLQKNYGIHDAYDGSTLHPDGRPSSAVPVTMDDGRTGEFVIPSQRTGAHPVYYRDDQTGDMHPVRMDPHVTRQQFVKNPRAVSYQPETRHSNQPSWEKDALVVGAATGGGALIGAAVGGSKGAGVGAVAGGVGGLIYDLLKQK